MSGPGLRRSVTDLAGGLRGNDPAPTTRKGHSDFSTIMPAARGVCHIIAIPLAWLFHHRAGGRAVSTIGAGGPG
jgi:hypothetical protein